MRYGGHVDGLVPDEVRDASSPGCVTVAEAAPARPDPRHRVGGSGRTSRDCGPSRSSASSSTTRPPRARRLRRRRHLLRHSGFLITGLLVTELDRTGTISWTRFLGRRVRRLLPAAVLVLVVTALFSWLLIPGLRCARSGTTSRRRHLRRLTGCSPGARSTTSPRTRVPRPCSTSGRSRSRSSSTSSGRCSSCSWPSSPEARPHARPADGRDGPRGARRHLLPVVGVVLAHLAGGLLLRDDDAGLGARVGALSACGSPAGSAAQPLPASSPSAGAGLLALVVVVCACPPTSSGRARGPAADPPDGPGALVRVARLAARPGSVSSGAARWCGSAGCPTRSTSGTGRSSCSGDWAAEWLTGAPLPGWGKVLAALFSVWRPGSRGASSAAPAPRAVAAHPAAGPARGRSGALGGRGPRRAALLPVRTPFVTEPPGGRMPADASLGAGTVVPGRAVADLTDPGWVVPDPLRAGEDRPDADVDRCQVDHDATVARRCTFGERGGAVTVALVGDSKAMQWLPRSRHGRRRRGGGSSPTGSRRARSPTPRRPWRAPPTRVRRVERRRRAGLAADRPDVVVTSGVARGAWDGEAADADLLAAGTPGAGTRSPRPIARGRRRRQPPFARRPRRLRRPAPATSGRCTFPAAPGVAGAGCPSSRPPSRPRGRASAPRPHRSGVPGGECRWSSATSPSTGPGPRDRDVRPDPRPGAR